MQRYQWEQPGDMIHVDIKQLARFHRVGHRITGDRRKGSSPGAGYENVDVAVVYADAGYQVIEKRPEMEGKSTTFRVVM